MSWGDAVPEKVCILGHFGEGSNLLNGQTVKTKIVTEELQNQFGQDQVRKVDTHGGAKTLLKAPFQVYSALKGSTNVLIFPAQNGLRVYAPLLSFFNRFFGRKLHYVVIGGWLPAFLKGRKHLSGCLKRFDGIYAETDTMKTALEAQGFDNVFVMPNCKKLTVLSEDELVYPDGAPYRLCTFSRVMKEKGIETAINAVETVNRELGYTAYSLDIYGQVDSAQTEWFEKLKSKFPSYIRYCGLVSFDKSVEVLKDYFALLFPTHYEGEGFAGTLIDAFSAGVPVIASDWKYNVEVVNERVGYICSTGDEQVFVQVLKSIALHPMAVMGKKRQCLKESAKYSVNAAVKILSDRMKES